MPGSREDRVRRRRRLTVPRILREDVLPIGCAMPRHLAGGARRRRSDRRGDRRRRSRSSGGCGTWRRASSRSSGSTRRRVALFAYDADGGERVPAAASAPRRRRSRLPRARRRHPERSSSRRCAASPPSSSRRMRRSRPTRSRCARLASRPALLRAVRRHHGRGGRRPPSPLPRVRAGPVSAYRPGDHDARAVRRSLPAEPPARRAREPVRRRSPDSSSPARRPRRRVIREAREETGVEVVRSSTSPRSRGRSRRR